MPADLSSTTKATTPLSIIVTRDVSNNRTLVIILSSVLPVVGVLFLAIAIALCCCYRRRKGKLFPRGISPIDDDEIETWKGNNGASPEKGGDGYDGFDSPPTTSTPWTAGGVLEGNDQAKDKTATGSAQQQPSAQQTLSLSQRARGVSLDSAGVTIGGRPPPLPTVPLPTASSLSRKNTIVYQDLPLSLAAPAATVAGAAAAGAWERQRRSEELTPPRSARSLSFGHQRRGTAGRFSFEKDGAGLDGALFLMTPLDLPLPASDVHAIAPNARAGLTDSSVPGDPSFLPSPKRHPSRLSKLPPTSATLATAALLASASGPPSRRVSLSKYNQAQHPPPPVSSWSRTRSGRSSSTVSGRSTDHKKAVLPIQEQKQQQQSTHHVRHGTSSSMSSIQPSIQDSPKSKRSQSRSSSDHLLDGSSSSNRGDGGHPHHYHQRGLSASSMLPPLSFGDNVDVDMIQGGLSPPPPQASQMEHIGRAIG